MDNCLKLIIKHFLASAIPKPTTEKFQEIIKDFYEKWNYPNCGGAIDGKHVRVNCPANAGSSIQSFYWQLSTLITNLSLSTLALMEEKATQVYKFIAQSQCGIEIDENKFKFPGIYLKSEMGKQINSGTFGIPPPAALPNTDTILPNVIIGDEAFALTNTMMKPYPRHQSLVDRSKTIYNYRHSRARRTTENAFGNVVVFPYIFHADQHKR